MKTMVLQRPSAGSLRKLLLCILVPALAAGCASIPPSGSPLNPGPPPGESVSPGIVSKPTAVVRPVEDRLRTEVRLWQNTPHKMGGSNRSGVDCSGFVQRLYHDLFRRPIPRTTALQIKSGRPVELPRLRAGDLVFFKPPDKIRHVGIYLGQGEFAHASSSQGVIVSSLSEDYWRRCYWTARRYLEPEANP